MDLSIDDWRELSDRLEGPLPELRARMYPGGNGGWWIHHPLCVRPFIDPDRCALWNHQFLAIKRGVEKAKAEGDWRGYVFWHCRGYRFAAFKRIARRLGPADYWDLLGDVWIDSENIRQHYADWVRAWNAHHPEKHRVMDDEEQAALARLPKTINVWRGIGGRGRLGLSWTLNRNRAMWFAHRAMGNKPRLLHGKVLRRNVHALLLGRNEDEIVADKVRVLRIEGLPPRED
jgi:hypothetical protein